MFQCPGERKNEILRRADKCVNGLGSQVAPLFLLQKLPRVYIADTSRPRQTQYVVRVQNPVGVHLLYKLRISMPSPYFSTTLFFESTATEG